MILRLSLVACLSAALWGQAAESAKPGTTPSPANASGTSANDSLASAKAFYEKGQFQDAATAFKAAVAAKPDSAEAHAWLVRSLLRAHEVDEAGYAAAKALEAAPTSALVHAAAGDVAFRTGKFGDAETQYRAALKADPNCARAVWGIGRIYEMVSFRKHAKDVFAKAHELDPDDKQIYNDWIGSLSAAEELAVLKKTAGDHPSEREQNLIKFLSAAAEKKTWALASEIKPTEIKMLPYGRTETVVFTGNREGLSPISKGYGLEVKFNDRTSAVLLLDTGASGIIIGHKLAERAGVVKVAETTFGGIGDKGPQEGYVGWINKIKIGSLEFQNCWVRVSSRNDVADESGLIGADVFDKFLVTLDFREWKMQLDLLPKNPNASGSEDEPQDRYVAPEMQSFTRIWRFGHDLVLPVVVSDKVTGNFVLDTGAALNIVTPQLLQQITKLSNEGAMMKGVSGTVKVLSGDKAVLQFARMRVRSDDIPAVPLDSLSNAEGTELSGLIGIRTLVQTKMTIDYRDGLVNLKVYEFKPARE
jgi:tetratricopeptide (TPR) repeat protein